MLTAAGTTVAYATVYAAYGVYGFLSPAAAFLLLGRVALVTLAAALRHGPALAALGLVGAFLTPMLVATDVPNYWALYVYLAVVSASAFVAGAHPDVALARHWRGSGAVPGPRRRRVLGVRGPRPSVALASRSASLLAARSASFLAARSASRLAARSASFFALFISAGFLFVARALFALGRDAELPDTTSASGVSGRLGRRRVGRAGLRRS